MTERLKDKVAVITGTAGGQGRAAALRFAREGAKIIGCDLKVAENRETVSLVKAAGGEMASMEPVDLTNEAEVERFFDFAANVFGGFDILYSNAAGTRPGPIEIQSRTDFEFTLVHELTLIFLAVKQALPVFRRRGGGAIVNTGSVAGVVGDGVGNTSGLLAHSVAKAGVIRMSEHMAIELSPWNIRVNTVSPGVVLTPPLEPFLSHEGVRKAYTDQLLIQRVGQPEDIVNAALYLVSDEASYVTGVNLIVDGGWTASGGVGRPSQEVAAILNEAVGALLAGEYDSVRSASAVSSNDAS